MIKKPADELVARLNGVHAEVENIIQDYLNEYADYGWDSTAEELRSICAGVDAIKIQLMYSRIR